MVERVIIREADKDDLESLLKLYREYDLYELSFDKEVKPDSHSAARKRTLGFFKSKKVRINIAEIDGKIVGLLDWSFSKENKEKIGIINNIIVTKSSRSKGVGKKLVNNITDYFKENGCKRVVSYVRPYNSKAHEFWKKRGFSFARVFKISKKL